MYYSKSEFDSHIKGEPVLKFHLIDKYNAYYLLDDKGKNRFKRWF